MGMEPATFVVARNCSTSYTEWDGPPLLPRTQKSFEHSRRVRLNDSTALQLLWPNTPRNKKAAGSNEEKRRKPPTERQTKKPRGMPR